MENLPSHHMDRPQHGLTRRDFLRVGGLGLGLTLGHLGGLRASQRSREMACIQLLLVGGPSHLETWDPKPDAPEHVRGPFGTIPTAIPGVRFSEHFPRLASLADRFALLRSIHHDEAPIHELGLQLIQTGGLSGPRFTRPHPGAVLSSLNERWDGLPTWVVLPGKIGNTGLTLDRGQSAGFLGAEHEPLCLGERLNPSYSRQATSHSHFQRIESNHASVLMQTLEGQQLQTDDSRNINRDLILGSRRLMRSSVAQTAADIDAEPTSVQEAYGRTSLGRMCLTARRLVERGVRFVTVNASTHLFHETTWDCHANGSDLPSTLEDYRRVLCPTLDQAFSALLQDLEQRGLLSQTLVVCLGEFGRTPKINRRGGRDHWTGVWSGILAGGPIRGGCVLGSSDRQGGEPKDRPVHPAEIVATVYHALGLDPATTLPAPDGSPYRLADADSLPDVL